MNNTLDTIHRYAIGFCIRFGIKHTFLMVGTVMKRDCNENKIVGQFFFSCQKYRSIHIKKKIQELYTRKRPIFHQRKTKRNKND